MLFFSKHTCFASVFLEIILAKIGFDTTENEPSTILVMKNIKTITPLDPKICMREREESGVYK